MKYATLSTHATTQTEQVRFLTSWRQGLLADFISTKIRFRTEGKCLRINLKNNDKQQAFCNSLALQSRRKFFEMIGTCFPLKETELHIYLHRKQPIHTVLALSALQTAAVWIDADLRSQMLSTSHC